MKNKYFYVSKEKASRFECLVYAVSDESIEIPIEDAIEYHSDNLPNNIYYNGEKIVIPSRYDLVLAGIESLNNYEFISGEHIYSIYDFPVPEGMVRPLFDKKKLEWIDTATEEEIAEHAFRQSVSFYNSELDFASKATAELACEIITAEMYEDVKSYMKAIDPYAPKKMSARKLKAISRPSVFDRYN